jgi:hypothetical protein
MPPGRPLVGFVPRAPERSVRVRAIRAGVTLDYGLDSDLRCTTRTGLEAPERVLHAAGEVFDCPLDQLALASDDLERGWMERV